MCNRMVPAGKGFVTCGALFGRGHVEAVLCDDCRKVALAKYPQGWKFVPGDTCTHGVFVGGMRDCACRQCEEGV